MKTNRKTSAEIMARYQRIARVMGASPFPTTRDRCWARLCMIDLQISHAIEFERMRRARANYGQTTVQIGAFASVE